MREMSKISEGTKEVPAGLESPTQPAYQEAKKADIAGKTELNVQTTNGHANGQAAEVAS